VTNNIPTTETGASPRQVQLLAPLVALRDPQSRLAWVVDQARHRPSLPDECRTDAFRVEGCLVRLWFVPEKRGELCFFRSDSDAASLKAITGLLCDYYSAESPESIASHHPDFLQRLGLLRHLADNRRATILRVADKIREFAVANRVGSPPPPAA
jgi:cysteine desulfuration protein SufE